MKIGQWTSEHYSFQAQFLEFPLPTFCKVITYKDSIEKAEEDKRKAVDKIRGTGEYGGETEEGGCAELEDNEFMGWLERTNPALYRLTTVKYKWDPPVGTLEDAYEEYAAMQVHADALRQAMEAHEAKQTMDFKHSKWGYPITAKVHGSMCVCVCWIF